MTPFTYWLAVSTVLQLSHPALATVIPAFANMAGLLGVGIPLVVGYAWARQAGVSGGAAFSRGFVLGWIPALIGLVLALYLGQVGTSILILGGLSSGVAGGLGAMVGGRGRGKA
ncbi:MAG TPA: hypothetical protein VJ925_11720 [Longimicrobiales bacterium]|nr:hypothetical protein [Longimicrobiales bacterium]